MEPEVTKMLKEVESSMNRMASLEFAALVDDANLSRDVPMDLASIRKAIATIKNTIEVARMEHENRMNLITIQLVEMNNSLTVLKEGFDASK